MNIVVDIGNSRFKSAREVNGVLEPFTPMPWRDVELSGLLDDTWASVLEGALTGDPEHRLRAIHVSNVAGDEVFNHLRQWCIDNLQLTPVRIRTEAVFGELKNGYQEPTKLGVDRWAAMIGAHANIDGALCVIDSGTATTVDIIDATGQHLGGAILPGIYTMRRSLGKYTAALFAASGDIQPFSDHTAAGIAGGTGYASAGAIDRLIDEARERLGDLTSIFTGGEAEIVAPLLRNKVLVDSHLVLHGVVEIARVTSEQA